MGVQGPFAETLRNEQYPFLCVECGAHPQVINIDGNAKSFFRLRLEETFKELKGPEGDIDVGAFYESEVEMTMVRSRWVQNGASAPFEHPSVIRKSVLLLRGVLTFAAPYVGRLSRPADGLVRVRAIDREKDGEATHFMNLDFEKAAKTFRSKASVASVADWVAGLFGPRSGEPLDNEAIDRLSVKQAKTKLSQVCPGVPRATKHGDRVEILKVGSARGLH